MKALNTNTQKGTCPLLALICGQAMKWTQGSKLTVWIYFHKKHPYFNFLRYGWGFAVFLAWNSISTNICSLELGLTCKMKLSM